MKKSKNLTNRGLDRLKYFPPAQVKMVQEQDKVIIIEICYSLCNRLLLYCYLKFKIMSHAKLSKNIKSLKYKINACKMMCGNY